MKKMIVLSVICFATLTQLNAQASEDKVEYNKKKETAIVMEYNYPPEVVEGAFTQKMSKMGFKGREEKGMFNNDKGFHKYKGARINEITNTPMDYVVKIERKSRKDKDETVLYLIMNKDGTNMLDVLDESIKNNAKTFLKDMLADIEAYDLEVKIKDQEETLAKAEKKMKNLENDLDDMEKKKKKLEEDIEQNKKDREKQKGEIEDQKRALDNLIMKRKA
jgi:hypothetical protein